MKEIHHLVERHVEKSEDNKMSMPCFPRLIHNSSFLIFGFFGNATPVLLPWQAFRTKGCQPSNFVF